MKGAGSRLQPGAVADCCLDWPGQALLSCAEGGIELVSVRFAEYEHVDVPYRPLAGLAFMAGGPRSVDVGCGDPVDVAQGFDQDRGDAECPGQNLGQAAVIRTGDVGPDKPRTPNLPRCDQAGLLSALDLTVDRRVGSADPRRDLRQAEFEIRITQQECKDLTLLLGTQDGQERWSWPSIHY